MTWPNDLKATADDQFDLFGKSLSEPRRLEVMDTTSTPEVYLRVQITKNSKGYTHETTASVRGDIPTVAAGEIVSVLLARGDGEARDEIKRREALDGEAG